MSNTITITMRELEREAEKHVRDLHERLGIEREPRDAGVGAGLASRHQAGVKAFFWKWGKP